MSEKRCICLTIMKKAGKLDIRLTEAQDAWLSEGAASRTIGKSTYLRQLIEEMRKGRIQLLEEDPAAYHAGPCKKKSRRRSSA